MYEISAIGQSGETSYLYRSTDKQAKIEIAELKHYGYRDIGMKKLSSREYYKLKHGKLH